MSWDVTNSLHKSVGHDGSSVDGEWTHHADQVTLEEAFYAVSVIAVSETL